MAQHTGSKTTSLPLGALDFHDRLQIRGGTDQLTVRRYAKAMRDGESFPPISAGAVGKKLYVIDGHHRVEAAYRARKTSIPVSIRNYRSLDEAHRAALLSNGDHGKALSNREKQAAFQSYLDAGLHLDEWSLPKTLGTIHHDCPFYTRGHIWKVLRAKGITVPRNDTKPFRPNGPDGWDEPSEEDLATDDAIALATFKEHLTEALKAFAILSETANAEALNTLREAMADIIPAPERHDSPLEI